MSTTLGRLIDRDDGQDLIEYALLGAFIVLVCVAAVQLLGTSIADALSDADTQLRSDGGVLP